MLRIAWVAPVLFAATGCFAAPAPSARVADVAREVNLAARFGRMELALEHTTEAARPTFSRHRQDWGSAVRVLDLELTGLSMKDAEHATVQVDIQWMRIDEDLLHTTRVEQAWRGSTDDNGWSLVRERRVAGDLGLFGERVARAEQVPHGDVQFASKTIR
jgi:hypothetical protein